MHVGAGEDLNYMGGMRTVEAMMHAAEVCNVHGSSVGSAVRQISSFNASSATITNMTKTSWTDFQKYAFCCTLYWGPHFRMEQLRLSGFPYQ